MNSEKPQPIRLVIVDDHPVLRDGLRRWLETEPDLKVIGEASNTAEAVKLVRELKPDILTTDLARPKDSGFETLRELNTLSSSSSIQLSIVRRALRLVKRLAGANTTPVRAILLTASIGKSQIVEAFQLGARGVVLKGTATEVLIEAMRRVRDGEYWVHREPVSNLVQYLRTLMQSMHEEGQKKFGLTPWQLEIVSAVVAGYSNKEMAEFFKIGEDTVKQHLSNIYDKLGVSSRLELALFAVNHGASTQQYRRTARTFPAQTHGTVIGVLIVVREISRLSEPPIGVLAGDKEKFTTNSSDNGHWSFNCWPCLLGIV